MNLKDAVDHDKAAPDHGELVQQLHLVSESTWALLTVFTTDDGAMVSTIY